MGRSVNKVTLIGSLGKDVEFRQMPNGNAVANLSLATDESYNDKQTGQKVEQTEWHRITAYGKLAEIMQQYLKKGSKAYIEGKLKTREWEKDGVKRYTTEIVASEMMMLDGHQQPQQSYQQPMQPQGHQQPPQQPHGYQQPPQPPQQPQPPHGYQQPPQQPQPPHGYQQPPQQPQQPHGYQQPQYGQQQPQRGS